MNDSDLGNHLVAQKEELLRLCNAGEMAKAKTLLDFVTPMWVAADYAYKVREVNQRIIGEANAAIATCEASLTMLTGRERTERQNLQHDIAEYRDLIGRCKTMAEAA